MSSFESYPLCSCPHGAASYGPVPIAKWPHEECNAEYDACPLPAILPLKSVLERTRRLIQTPGSAPMSMFLTIFCRDFCPIR